MELEVSVFWGTQCHSKIGRNLCGCLITLDVLNGQGHTHLYAYLFATFAFINIYILRLESIEFRIYYTHFHSW